jgi:hypothetical protein
MQVQLPPQPWINNYARQADEAFNASTVMTDDELRALRPPLPQIQYLPPRFGYPSYADRQWSIMQVFGITRTPSGDIPGMPRMHGEDRVDYSRSQSSQQGSDRNTNSGDPLGLGGGGTGL